jgi:hypothetical protein
MFHRVHRARDSVIEDETHTPFTLLQRTLPCLKTAPDHVGVEVIDHMIVGESIHFLPESQAQSAQLHFVTGCPVTELRSSLGEKLNNHRRENSSAISFLICSYGMPATRPSSTAFTRARISSSHAASISSTHPGRFRSRSSLISANRWWRGRSTTAFAISWYVRYAYQRTDLGCVDNPGQIANDPLSSKLLMASKCPFQIASFSTPP